MFYIKSMNFKMIYSFLRWSSRIFIDNCLHYQGNANSDPETTAYFHAVALQMTVLKIKAHVMVDVEKSNME